MSRCRATHLPASLWGIIFANLSPQDIGRAALACSACSRAARTVTAARCKDAAHGLEAFEIPFINDLGRGPLYAHFRYVKFCEELCHGSKIIVEHSCVRHDVSARKEVPHTVSPKQGDSEDCFICCPCDSPLESRSLRSMPLCHVETCPCGVTSECEQAYDSEGLLCVFTEHFQLPPHDLLAPGEATPPSLDLTNLTSEVKPIESFSRRHLILDGVKKDGEVPLTTPKHQPHSPLPPRSWPPEPEPDAVFECGPFCGCALQCVNRQSQRGLAVRVVVKRHQSKGWALHAGEAVPGGRFICQYAGEVLTSAEAKRRLSRADAVSMSWSTLFSSPQPHPAPPPAPPNYLMVVREHFPPSPTSRETNLDPTSIGNVGRFMNHACDGGNVAPILLRQRGWDATRVGLYARRDIEEGEELCFAYGGSVGNEGGGSLRDCLCGSRGCQGKLPREGM